MSAFLQTFARFVATLASVLALAWLGHIIAGEGQPLGLVLPLACLGAIVIAGWLTARIAPGRLPDLVWISFAAMLAGAPIHPLAPEITRLLGELNAIAVMTPIMAYAALGIDADDVALFRRTGLKMIAITMLVFAGTFMGSAFIANLALGGTP